MDETCSIYIYQPALAVADVEENSEFFNIHPRGLLISLYARSLHMCLWILKLFEACEFMKLWKNIVQQSDTNALVMVHLNIILEG